jgi:hypothetical protein
VELNERFLVVSLTIIGKRLTEKEETRKMKTSEVANHRFERGWREQEKTT